MKYLSIFVLITICSISSAKSNTITPEFIALLKKNYYEKSLGINNPRNFFSSLKSIADKGDPSAQFFYGMLLSQESTTVAKQYLSRSADAGCTGSEMILASLNMVEENTEEGIRLFKSSAINGDASAQVAMSGFYNRGSDGFERSRTKAYAWLMLAKRQTFSNGALAAIEEAINGLNMTDAEIKEASNEYETLATTIGKREYFFCGQGNIDTSRARDVEFYLKMQ